MSEQIGLLLNHPLAWVRRIYDSHLRFNPSDVIVLPQLRQHTADLVRDYLLQENGEDHAGLKLLAETDWYVDSIHRV